MIRKVIVLKVMKVLIRMLANFERIFNSKEELVNEKVITCIPEMVNEDQNQML